MVFCQSSRTVTKTDKLLDSIVTFSCIIWSVTYSDHGFLMCTLHRVTLHMKTWHGCASLQLCPKGEHLTASYLT